MKKIFLVLSLLSLSAFAQIPKVSQGQAITAEQFNKLIDQLVPIGTIYNSVLSLAQFQDINGNCWKLMDGTSLAGTDLGALMGSTMINLPQATTNGAFLRQKLNATPMGEYQGDAIRNITGYHYVNDETNTSAFAGGAFYKTDTSVNSTQPGTSGRTWKSAQFNFDASIVVPTADENRPKNISVNMFIKVNKTCSTP